MSTHTESQNALDRYPLGQPIIEIDGYDLHQMLGAGYSWLKQHSHIVNALNVFPVPDGDTGTNMVLTMQSAWREAAAEPSDIASKVMHDYAYGAIRGARGNSGVILSQILRGFSEHLRDSPTINAGQLALAMAQGKDTAYHGVVKPVEGTILTVIREAADASGHAAAINADLRFVLSTTLAKAQQALNNTPNLLPVLKQAGVVDAGGQGLYYLLEGMTRYLHGDPMFQPDQVVAETEPVPMPQPNLNVFVEDEWGYDIQFLIFADNLDEQEIRESLLAMGGESVVVGRADEVVKVHVHHADPGPFLSFGASLGQLDDIVLENMTLQTLRRKGEWDPHIPASLSAQDYLAPQQPQPAKAMECLGVVAVATGDGLKRVFESFGVCEIVSGGQTMNPSTEELLRSIENLAHEDVVVLPNNKNIILAARQAAQLSSKRAHVIETHSIPHGFAAMLGFSPQASAEKNIANMTAAARHLISAEITTAVREASIDGFECVPGDLIGLIEGRLCCRGAQLDDVVRQVLEQIDPDEETELFTLYYGELVPTDQAQALVEELKDDFPDYEIELVYGGQPHYHYLISAE